VSLDRVGKERVIMSGRMNLAPYWDAATASLSPYRAPRGRGGSPIANEQLGYGYDGGWNMTQRTVNGSPTSYTVNDRNQVTAIGPSETTVFDANGNLISRFNSGGPNGLTYVYDEENRLVAVHTDTY
jgi:YD repeat-containing protein